MEPVQGQSEICVLFLKCRPAQSPNRQGLGGWVKLPVGMFRASRQCGKWPFKGACECRQSGNLAAASHRCV